MDRVLKAEDAERKLINEWDLPPAHAARALQIAIEHGVNVTNSGDMRRVVTIRNLGKDPYTFSLTEGTPSQKDSRKKIDRHTPPPQNQRYTSGVPTERKLAAGAGTVGESTPGKDRTMAKAAAVEAETPEEAVDLTVYLEKDVTPTILDYHEFLETELGVEVDQRSVYLAVTLYKFFQGSDFSRVRKEQRRAEKAAAAAARAEQNGAEDEETEEADEAPAKPARGRKTAAAATTTETAPKRGRPAGKAATAPAPAAPRRRGRPAKAAAGEPAPY